MNKVSFDHSTDYSLREFNSFIKQANFIPDYVKEASVVSSEDIQMLPKEAFADPLNKAFPKNNKSNVYLSHIHFVNKEAALKEKYNQHYVDSVAKNLKEAAELFGIQDDLVNYSTQRLEKVSYDYTSKVVFEKSIEGHDISLFAYKTAAELKVAAESFASQYKKFPFEWRKEISNSFVKHAEEMHVDELPNIICKYAEMFYADPEHFKTELTRRAFRNPDKEAKLAYQQIIDMVDEFDSMDDYVKSAEICYNLEKSAGIHDNVKLAKLFGDPMDVLFTVPLEKVAEALDVVKIGEDFYKTKDILNVSSEIFREAFGIDKAASADEVRDVMPTMPLGDFNLFVELSGIRPV